MDRQLTVSISPHIHDGSSTQRVMFDVIIALVPASLVSIWLFGVRAVILLTGTIAAAVLAEMVSRKLMKRDTDSIYDLTAVITGLLLALSLPPTMPLWQAMVGSAIAIVIVKQFFGGVGQNFVNPAIAGRLVLFFSYPAVMAAGFVPPLGRAVDSVSGATPLAHLAEGTYAYLPSNLDLFLGIHAGSLGETSILALLIGGIYLVWRKVISPIIPLTFIGTTLLIVALAGGDVLAHLLSGSLVIVAVFMATDYATSPLNFKGRIVFGIGCGFITAVIRLWGALPEGVSFAVIIMNILVPHIETLTMPKAFGGESNG